jgi:hypothetical protein
MASPEQIREVLLEWIEYTHGPRASTLIQDLPCCGENRTFELRGHVNTYMEFFTNYLQHHYQENNMIRYMLTDYEDLIREYCMIGQSWCIKIPYSFTTDNGVRIVWLIQLTAMIQHLPWPFNYYEPQDTTWYFEYTELYFLPYDSDLEASQLKPIIADLNKTIDPLLAVIAKRKAKPVAD